MSNTKLSVKSAFNQAMDFFKQHYEHLLPFSLIFFIILIPTFFIKNPIVNLVITLLFIPLTMSIPYYADMISNGEDKSFSVLFDTVKFLPKLAAVFIIKYIILLILFIPLILFFYNNIDMELMTNMDYATLSKELPELIKNNKLFKNGGSVSGLMQTYFWTFLLIFLITPFFIFVEYFLVLGNQSIAQSFKSSIMGVYKNYGKVILFMILLIITTSIIAIMTCSFGLIFIIPIVFLTLYYFYKKLSE